VKDEPVEILELLGKRPRGIKPGLDRINKAWQYLDTPSALIPCVLVGGTNGKGSTSGYIWSLLSRLGFRVGLFSSPHILEFRERITLPDGPASNELLLRAIEELKQQLPTVLWQQLSFFEINTLLALKIFASIRLDYMVLEVGLGGRLDCTNIVDPVLSVITSIGLDHREYLGNTLPEIAFEKCGIMRSGCPVIWGGSSEALVSEVIQAEARKKRAQLMTMGREFSCDLSGEVISWDQLSLKFDGVMAQKPKFLRRNFCMAVAAVVQLLSKREDRPLMLQKLQRDFGDSQTKCPVTLWGRFQKVTTIIDGKSISLILDVAHNTHGAASLAEALSEQFGDQAKFSVVVSILKDKDVSSLWAVMAPKVKSPFFYKNTSERSWDVEDLPIKGERLWPSFKSALSAAISDQELQGNLPIVVFGSVYALGDVMRDLRLKF
jgi:dihydrofolate synthase / folylpolyglutamate synthase